MTTKKYKVLFQKRWDMNHISYEIYQAWLVDEEGKAQSIRLFIHAYFSWNDGYDSESEFMITMDGVDNSREYGWRPEGGKFNRFEDAIEEAEKIALERWHLREEQ